MALSNATSANASSAEEFGFKTLPPDSYDSYSTHADVIGSAVSWGAILAGAAAAVALSLILLLLGAGLGLSTISPWASKGLNASTFGISTIVWLTVTQILAAGMGGYLAGRLRTKWANAHADEVYFRDTAHGFLTWSVATLTTAALLTSVIGAILNGGLQAATLVGDAATTTMTKGVGETNNAAGKSNNISESLNGPMGYFMDALFRTDATTVSASSIEGGAMTTDSAQKSTSISEVTRIFTNSTNEKTLPAADITYISQLVSKHAGLTLQEAENRVNDIYANMQLKKRNAEIAAKDTAEKVRKASIYTTLWLFVSLLMGAFSASLAATWGGRSRDA